MRGCYPDRRPMRGDLSHASGELVRRERRTRHYVLDGRHRVSVARALGHDRIDAWASRSLPRSTAPPSTKETAMAHLIHAVLDTVRHTLRPTERLHFHAADD